MNRREFLESVAAATVPLPALGRSAVSTSQLEMPTVPTVCCVNDLGDECALRESVLGYQSAVPISPPGGRRWRTVFIYPGALDVTGVGESIRWNLRCGGTVIVESGGAFAGHPHYGRHRHSLREELQLEVNAPVDLWSGSGNAPRTPYVQLTWPLPAAVRDFSRVVPVADQPGDVIAWAGDVPVGLVRRVSRGTLVYLGTPLGPALWAGDQQARRWLHQVIAS
ncbi:MAG TPA: hypothetical protein VL549_11560 [Gemmatimonadales bacterium]|jgi:hypothetical protein|nr:hypothetical protein [Gemmatimonadales bacterium]